MINFSKLVRDENRERSVPDETGWRKPVQVTQRSAAK